MSELTEYEATIPVGEVTNDHVVLIAGPLTGIARAAAFAYAKTGNHIVVASDNKAAGLRLVQELRSRTVDAEYSYVDAYSEEEILNVIDKTKAHYGHLDVQYRP